jgi:hypothetical protein
MEPPFSADSEPAAIFPALNSAITIAATTASPSSHPITKTRLFVRARFVNRIKIKPMIGNGLNAIPIANGRKSPIASPIAI